MALLSRGAVALTKEGPSYDVQVEGERKHQPAVHKRLVDPLGSYMKFLLRRAVHEQPYNPVHFEPTALGAIQLLPPAAMPGQPATSFNTKFVHVTNSKERKSVNCAVWTPEGRRCVTGSQSGEFSLWNGQTFRFETTLQAHEYPIRAMLYSHNENWLISGDDGGLIKYFKPNFELVKVYPTHKEAVRGVSMSPTDLKFATCSDDSTVRIWDFARCSEDSTLSGHGGDVRTVDWHPVTSLVASGSKDCLVKLWDARAGPPSIASIHGHKALVTHVEWNRNGNWLMSASRDGSLRVTSCER
eukprot:jgi/Botrbrau1/16820/Bobra.150_2s0047.1